LKRSGAEAGYRRALADQLRGESAELEDYVFDRIRAREEALESERRRSLEGLRKLIGSLIDYGCLAIEVGEERCPPPPPAVIAHARSAAWSPLPARILQQRYLTAYTAFKRYLWCEAAHPKGHTEAALAQVVESTEIVFERLVATVGEEHEQELQKKGRSSEARRLERIEALLAGEVVEAPELDYDFGATHVGIVAIGSGTDEHIKQVARSLGGRLLLVQSAPQKCWAWIGATHGISSSLLKESLSLDSPTSARISLGEPARGVPGWRRTHREAKAGLPVADWPKGAVVRYSEVLLLAVVLSDDLLITSLEDKYLAPLAVERDGGEILKNTLRAYFSQNRHISSAAELLGVKRHTVRNRLDLVEERLGRTIDSCAAELELALRVDTFLPSSSTQLHGRGG
jgi:PucR-like helix-turn-helix protein/diguanylate cyclase with GGDEF domain